MQPEKIAEVKEWLTKGLHDMQAAEQLRDTLPDVAAFHFQQAAEKVVKALLTWHDVPFRKTHNLAELGRQCLSLDSAMEPVLVSAIPLSDYAWEFRYPGGPAEPDVDEMETAERSAKALFDAILSRLPDIVRP
jgi:HEPN domain-containing protein